MPKRENRVGKNFKGNMLYAARNRLKAKSLQTKAGSEQRTKSRKPKRENRVGSNLKGNTLNAARYTLHAI